MKYEEKMVFPYVQALIDGNAKEGIRRYYCKKW